MRILFLHFSILLMANTGIIFSQFKPEIIVQNGHKGIINHLHFSNDGNFLVSAQYYDSGVCKLWDVKNGKLLRNYFIPGWISDIGNISSENSFFLTVGGDSTLAFNYDSETYAGKFKLVNLAFNVKLKYMAGIEMTKYGYNAILMDMSNKKINKGSPALDLFSAPQIHLTNDGAFLICGKFDEIFIFETPSMNLIKTVHRPDKSDIKKIGSTNSSENFLVLDQNHLLCSYKTSTGILNNRLNGYPIRDFHIIKEKFFAIDSINMYVFNVNDFSLNLKKSFPFAINAFSLTPDGNFIAVAGGDEIGIYTYPEFRCINIIKQNTAIEYYKIQFSKEGPIILNSGNLAGDSAFIAICMPDGNLFRKIRKTFRFFEYYLLENQKLFFLKNFQKAIVMDPNTSLFKNVFNDSSVIWSHNLVFDKSQEFFLTFRNYDMNRSEVMLWSIFQKNPIKKFELPFELSDVVISPDAQQFIAFEQMISPYHLLYKYDMSGEELNQIKKSELTKGQSFKSKISPDSRYIAFSGFLESYIYLYDYQTLKLLTRLKFDTYINDFDFNSDGSTLAVLTNDGFMHFWKTNDFSKLWYKSYITSPPDFFQITGDNFYYSSKSLLNKIHFVDKTNYYSLENFDLIFNRPDKVLKTIGFTDSILVEGYYKAYLKRLSKLNLKENSLSMNFNKPEIELKEFYHIENITSNPEYIMEVKVKDKLHHLDRINLWIDDVPVFGIKGFNIKDENSKSYTGKFKLILSQGLNKIQVSAQNAVGAESFKKSVEITYEPEKKQKPQLFFIGIGCAEYEDRSRNLKYSVKDVRDMANMLAGATHLFRNIFVDTLFNSMVTQENVLKLKSRLLKSEVNDHIILFISGHGILDNNLDFYFASHRMNFYQPEENGIRYEMLESILDSIPARQKLFLIDACHSGEIDKSEVDNSKDSIIVLTDGKKAQLTKGGINIGKQNKKLGLENSFELMQELFTNLNKGTGAVVISAAAGDGYALESPEWNNGVFTYSILHYLKNNKQGIKVSQLKEFVIKEVERLTNGRQKPTSRLENISNDFIVW